MTVDVEEWFDASLVKKKLPNNPSVASSVEKTTRFTLELFKKYNVTATFFIVGSVAEQYPHLISEIHNQGHEIGLHSFSHDLIYTMSRAAFRQDVEKGIECLQQAVGADIRGYRAPSWSADQIKTPWFWQTLYDRGFKYSSSIFPFSTFLYGSARAPIVRHQVPCKHGALWEIPPAVLKLWKVRIPFAGGFYFRLLPSVLIQFSIRWYYRMTGEPAVLYMHPYEINDTFPRIKLAPATRFVQYYNVHNTGKKLEKILLRNDFVSISQFYGF